jgi:hypothetical protein
MTGRNKRVKLPDLADLDLSDLLPPEQPQQNIDLQVETPTRTKSGFVTKPTTPKSMAVASPERVTGVPMIVATGTRPPAPSPYSRRASLMPRGSQPKPELSIAAQLVRLFALIGGFLLAVMIVTWLIYR